MPHPNRGPRNPSSSFRTNSSGVSGSTARVWRLPFTFSVISLIRRLFLCSQAFLFSLLLSDANHPRNPNSQFFVGRRCFAIVNFPPRQGAVRDKTALIHW